MREIKDIEFNLLDEPWIRVVKPDCSVEEVSLTDALLHAHEYEDLAGELPTQDIAILRVLLAVLHTVFSRVDAEGNPEHLDEENALERWEELWELKAFPEKPIQDYLDQWHERFWLFHPERPFFQVPTLEFGHRFKIKKLDGAISESDNKIRLFSSKSGDAKLGLSYAEAARWLISINAFDDNVGAKPVPTRTNMPPCGVGWLGQLGLIIAQGKNLFETLLFNLVLLRNGNKNWGKCIPVWEKQEINIGQHIAIPVPDNPSELYTLQSRRLLLVKNNGKVTEYLTLGGDFIDSSSAFSWEPMTLWRKELDRKGNVIGYKPYLHDKSKQIWRLFPVITGIEKNAKLSGLVSWIISLSDTNTNVQKSMIRFKIASIVYGGGSQKSSIENIFSDFLSINCNILNDSGKIWQKKIEYELIAIDEIAKLLKILSNKLFLANGWREKNAQLNPQFVNNAHTNYIKDEFYFRVNEPFRIWLTKLSSKQNPEEMLVLQLDWHEQAKKIAWRIGEELIEKSGPQTFCGRKVNDKKNNKEFFYSAPEAFNSFSYRLNHIYDSKGA